MTDTSSMLRLPASLALALTCPRCGSGPLRLDPQQLTCPNPGCAASFPVILGCPILINDDNSAFSIDDFLLRRKTTGEVRQGSDSKPTLKDRTRRLLNNLTPSISYPVSDYSVRKALNEIAERIGRPIRLLIVGAGDAMARIEGNHEVVYSDVDLGNLTSIICDAHDIPFADGTFDAVLCDSVMEHVADPWRCASEIERVLRPGGYVYAITPFMMQVHMGPYDFTRFTHLGHRRLFRRFDEIASGVSNGPGMALAWSVERFLAGFATRPGLRSAVRTAARFIVFPIKYFDRVLARRAAAYDDAAAFYFFGMKNGNVLSDRELVRGYRGTIR